MNNETCIHGGISPTSMLEGLHHSQGGSGRHRCPTCAFEQGFNLGSSKRWESYDAYCKSLLDPELCKGGSVAPTSILTTLGGNQGGPGRHKCTNCAFKQGFELGHIQTLSNHINLKLVPAPAQGNLRQNTRTLSPSSVDFEEKENNNKQLGYLGELLVLRNEIQYLEKHGRPELAKKVFHVSVEQGDGLGYDILSYDLEGQEKKIEVKTTRGNINRPFYLTKNELSVSIKHAEDFFLYRLFDFDSQESNGKYYVVEGNLLDALVLDPIVYTALPNSGNA